MRTDEVRGVPEKKAVPYSAGAWLLGIALFLVTGYVTALLLFSTWVNCDITRPPRQRVPIRCIELTNLWASSALTRCTAQISGTSFSL